MKQPDQNWSGCFSHGSGGWIRTIDLRVMSPTSCRCSTPRRRAIWRLGSGVWVPPWLGTGGVRGGLASRGVAPTVLSGAALGHDRVRDGTGWGQHALGHGRPRSPAWGPDSTPVVTSVLSWAGARTPGGVPPRPRARPGPQWRMWDQCSRSRGLTRVWEFGGSGGSGPGGTEDRPRPSARLGSGRLPAVHPPPVNPVVSRGPYPVMVGRLVLGRGSRLDAFSG